MNLIPFGLRSDGVYIDAEDATRGKSCDCVCPSCGIALIARQGNVNASHFAHDSKGGSKEEIKACQFSFFVSVRYMLKQLIRKTVWKEARLSVCVGIGSKLTLAKVANHAAKKIPSYEGVCLIDNEADRIAILKQLSVGDVWGIGRRISKKLELMVRIS